MGLACRDAYARAFRILALGVTCPDEELASMVADGTMGRAMDETARALKLSWERADRPPASHEHEAGGRSDISLLRREYTRLFSAPTGPVVPLWETAFLELQGEFGPQLVRTATADDARRFYRACGWDLARNEAADHMGIELEFAAYALAGIGRETQKADAEDGFAQFWDRHLSRWMVPFFERVAHEARQGFYGEVGRFGAEVGATLEQNVL